MKEKYYKTKNLYVGYVNLDEYQTLLNKRIYKQSQISRQIFNITYQNGQLSLEDISTTFYPKITTKYYQNIPNLTIESFIPITYFLKNYEQQEIYIPLSRLRELYIYLNPSLKEKASPSNTKVLRLSDYTQKKERK